MSVSFVLASLHNKEKKFVPSTRAPLESFSERRWPVAVLAR
jgi:hypothetical protein